jgi:hypothetical protein
VKALVRAFDHMLVRAQGLYPYWDDPKAMFRIRVVGAPHMLHLSDGKVPAGAPVMELHFWNDQTPPFAPQGPDLAWAMSAYRMLVPSLRILAQQLATKPEFAEVQALGGATVLVAVGGQSAAEKLFERLGLELFPYPHHLGRFGEFWENFYTWALMWAYNGLSLRSRHLLDLPRTEVWISRTKFLSLHGEAGAKKAQKG